MNLGWLKLNWRLLWIFFRMGAGNLRARLLGEERDSRVGALAHVRATAPAGDPSAVLAALDDFGRNKRFLMNVGDQKGPLLRALIAALPAGARVLELGAFVGYSAVLISDALGADGRLVSLEKDPESTAVARAVVEHAGLGDRVDLRCGDSAELIPALEGHFDLVFIDHWKDLYKRDLQAIEAHGLLKKGSMVVADNVGPAFDATEYLDYVRGCGHYQTRYQKSTIEYSSMEDGVEISIFQGA